VLLLLLLLRWQQLQCGFCLLFCSLLVLRLLGGISNILPEFRQLASALMTPVPFVSALRAASLGRSTQPRTLSYCGQGSQPLGTHAAL
jgi:hypothetical protein